MKQPKVLAPEIPPPAPVPPAGPRYRYFSNPPTTVSVKLGDLPIPAEARTPLFDASRTIDLPADKILQGPVPKVRLSQLAEIIPDALVKTDDALLRLPIARLAVSYKFIQSQELIEDKPLPPLEPLISTEGSFVPGGTAADFAPRDLPETYEDLPPDDFVPPTPEAAVSAPAPLAPPPPRSAPSFQPRTAFTPPPVAESPAPAPAPEVEAPKPAGKKVFSLLPLFRRKEPEAPPVEPAVPAPSEPTAPAPPRARVEIPKPRTVLPPITARVAEAMPPAPANEPAPVVENAEPEIPPHVAEEEEIFPPLEETNPFVQPAAQAAPVAEPVREPAPAPAVWVETEHLPKSSPTSPSAEIPDQDGLQSVFMTEEYLTLERVIELSGNLPGIKSCVLSQGRSVLAAHNAPDNIDLVSLSANAVEMLHAMRQSAAKMGVGAIPAVTIHSDKGPITFFHQEDLCLLVMHKDRGFVPGVREKLQQVVHHLSYANLALPVAPSKPSLGE